MESEQFFLKWNNFENNLTSGFADLLQQEAMVDVTLAVEGKIIQAHKIILSICSSYFRNMFQLNPCQHPIVVLKDVGYQELTDMLDFMYKGEANVRQEDLPSFLKLAETLKVKGLAGNPAEGDENINKTPKPQSSNITKDKLSEVKNVLFRNTMEDDDNDNDVGLKRKRKRPISPHKNSDIKSLPYPQNIKLEIDDCDDHFLENNMEKNDFSIAKGERLNDQNLDVYENNNSASKNEKDAGPSTLDDNYDPIPHAPEVVKSSEYTFVESCFGGRLLVYSGYCYRRKSSTSDRSYWFCLKPQCLAKGILQTDGTFYLTCNKHTHDSDFEEVDERKKMLELKKMALKLNSPGKDILKMLNIKEDKKYLSFIRTWRSRHKKQSSETISELNSSAEKKLDCRRSNLEINVGSNYKMVANRRTSKNTILYLGYAYRQDSLNRRKECCKYWRCKVSGCKARAKTLEDGALIVSKIEHSHPPNSPLRKKASLIKLRDKASKTTNSNDSLQKHDDNNLSKYSARSTRENSENESRQTKIKWEVLSNKNSNENESFNIDKIMTDTLNNDFDENSEFRTSFEIFEN